MVSYIESLFQTQPVARENTEEQNLSLIKANETALRKLEEKVEALQREVSDLKERNIILIRELEKKFDDALVQAIEQIFPSERNSPVLVSSDDIDEVEAVQIKLLQPAEKQSCVIS